MRVTPRRVDELWELLRAQVDPAGLRWLEGAVERMRGDRGSLATVFPAAGRHVGRGPLRLQNDPARGRPTVSDSSTGDPDEDHQGNSLSAGGPAGGGWGAGSRGMGGSSASDPSVASLAAGGASESGAGGVGVHGWTVDDAARALLLVAAGEGVWGELEELYRFGDAAERRGVLRALHLLPEPPSGGGTSTGPGPGDRDGTSGGPGNGYGTGRRCGSGDANGDGKGIGHGDEGGDLGVRLVDDAIRTNDPRLLAAALGPYAVERLGEEAFNQAILKCVFVGVPLAGLEGVAERATPSLARMLAAYVRERVAAGRDTPADVWPLIDAHPPADELGALEAELTHPVESRRQAAATALAQRATHRAYAPSAATWTGAGDSSPDRTGQPNHTATQDPTGTGTGQAPPDRMGQPGRTRTEG